MKEAEQRGEDVATQDDLSRTLREVLQLNVRSMLVVLAVVGMAIGYVEYDRYRENTQRDLSFSLICGVLQRNAVSDGDFANAVVKLVPPKPPPVTRVRNVRDTAITVRDRHRAFAAAKCDSRADLARLLERDAIEPPTTKESP